MKLRFVRVMYTVALCLLCTCMAVAQPYKQLKVNDFAGLIPASRGSNIAYTNCSINLNYRDCYADNYGYYHIKFNVELRLNNQKSWLNKQAITSAAMLADVLKHEQGHYQLAFLLQQEMLQTLNSSRFTINYQSEANAIFKRINAKYHQLNQDYDDDTNHMINRKQQTAWELWLNQQVSRWGTLAMN